MDLLANYYWEKCSRNTLLDLRYSHPAQGFQEILPPSEVCPLLGWEYPERMPGARLRSEAMPREGRVSCGKLLSLSKKKNFINF
jgi:hypothetical protein